MLFRDIESLSLSKEQQALLDDWKRPSEALPPPSWGSFSNHESLVESCQPIMKAIQKVDLVQDAATDCSVVASLSTAIARFERGHSEVWKASSFCSFSGSGSSTNASSFWLPTSIRSTRRIDVQCYRRTANTLCVCNSMGAGVRLLLMTASLFLKPLGRCMLLIATILLYSGPRSLRKPI